MALFNNKPNVPEIKQNNISQVQPQVAPQPINQFPSPNTQGSLPQPKPVLPSPVPQPSIFEQPMNRPQQSFGSMQISHPPQVTPELRVQKGIPLSDDQPFFVRIDKFNETRDNFEKVNIKVEEMEKILENLEYSKAQEDRELASWKEEISEMKSYLAEIDKEIFSKI